MSSAVNYSFNDVQTAVTNARGKSGGMTDTEEDTPGYSGTNGNLLAPPTPHFERWPLRSSLIKDMSRRHSPSRKTVSFSSMPQDKKVSNVNDCYEHMMNGMEFTKIRSHQRQYRRRFTLDADHSHVRWTPTNKKPHKAKIPIESIKEVRVGRNTDLLRSMDAFFAELQDDCAFSIIYGDNAECIDLAASAADSANIWVTGLMALLALANKSDGTASTSHITDPEVSSSTLRERWLRTSFATFDTEETGELTEKQVVKLARQLNPRLSAHRIKIKFKEFDLGKPEEQRGKIAQEDFVELYKDLSTRPEVYFLMVRFANKDYMAVEDLLLFLETEQGLPNVDKDFVADLIDKYELSDTGKAERLMTVDGFTNYLLSPECSLFDPSHEDVCQDMGLPLSDYFIACSNNTYLVEDQLKGPSSVDGYICALKRGCRMVELDIWEDNNGMSFVCHGKAISSRLALSEALTAINEFAFEKSVYPLIVKIEQHLTVDNQQVLAASLRTVFGDRLYTPPPPPPPVLDSPPITMQTSVNFQVEPRPVNPYPTPEQLQGKILIMSKYAHEYNDVDEAELTEEDESSESNRRPSRRQPQKRITVCRQLAELTCTFLAATHLRDVNSSLEVENHDGVGYVVSANEGTALKLAHTHTEDFARLTRSCLTRVYPNAVRVDSSNMNPQEFWNFGIQCVALNYQTPGLMMDLQEGKFLANGGCGFVVKPSIMRDIGGLGPNVDGASPIVSTPQVLYLKIISGQNLPRPRGSTAKGDSADPFVVIEIFGVPLDCAEERTRTVRNDSYSPSFDESFQFQVTVAELALVRMLVLDDDYIGDDFIGQYTIPFECLQPGYRHLTLLNNEGEVMDNCTLFVHVAVTNKRGGGKARKRGMSVRRKQQRIQTGVKMVGVKQLDELFKSAVIPLAECIELRNALECATTDWQESCGIGPSGSVRQGLRLLHNRVCTVALTASPAVTPDATRQDATDTDVGTSMRIFIEPDGTPHAEYTGILPDQLQRAFAALEHLLARCQLVLDRTDQLLQKLEEATRRIAESYEELSTLCIEAGLRGQKATRATENFAWNVRLLKAQLDLMYRTQQEARNTMQQVSDTGSVLGILTHRSSSQCTSKLMPKDSMTHMPVYDRSHQTLQKHISS